MVHNYISCTPRPQCGSLNAEALVFVFIFFALCICVALEFVSVSGSLSTSVLRLLSCPAPIKYRPALTFSIGVLVHVMMGQHQSVV